jgi:Calcineurin-like phosphoesterase superfamily domain
VLAAVVSDLHLGARSRNDLLRRPALRRRLLESLRVVDELVLLGDVVELREGPVEEALDAALPALEELGEAVGEARVVVVPGNHDHQLLGGRGPGSEEAVRPGAGEPLARIAARMPSAELVVAYPGYGPRADVWATHGHYLDCHNAIPTLETVAAAVLKRRTGGFRDGRLGAGDYEAALAPLYGLAYRAAQRRSRGAGRRGPGPSMRAWELLETDEGRRSAAGRLLGRVVLPGGVALLNRARLGSFVADVSAPTLRRAALRAMGEVVERLGIDVEHVLFGHTHRPGPLAADAEEWITPGGARLANCGSWVYEPPFLGESAKDSPHWPGTLVLLEDGRPPRLECLLADLSHEELRAA